MAFLLLFFSNILFLFSEISIKSQIIDQDGHTVSYANVYNLSTNQGSFSTLDGRIQLKADESDTIAITCMGYETVKVLAESIGDTIFLIKKTYELGEVKVTPQKSTIRSIGYSDLKSKTYFGNRVVGTEICVLARDESLASGSCKVKAITLRKKKNASGKIRIHLYSRGSDGKPENEVLQSNIFIDLKDQRGGVVKVDISEENVPLPSDGLFVGVEWLDKGLNTTASPAFCFVKTEPTEGYLTYRKTDYSFEKVWEHLNEAHYGRRNYQSPVLNSVNNIAFGLEVECW